MHASVKEMGTRWQQHEAQAGQAPAVPQIEAGSYLLAAFVELGCATPTGFGLAPLAFAEIRAFGELTGDIVEGWEAILVRRMSLAYIAEMKRGEGPLAKPPEP